MSARTTALPWTDPRHPWMEDVLVLDVVEDPTPAYVPPVRGCAYCGVKLVGFQLLYCSYAHRERHAAARRRSA